MSTIRKITLALLAALVLVGVAGAVGPATNLDVIAFSQKSVTIRWTPSAGATGYRLYKDGVAVSTAGAAATTAKFGNLTYGQHIFGVAPLPDGGVSTITVTPRWVEIGSTEPTPPPPPPPPPVAQRFDTTAPAGTTGLPRSLTNCMASIVRDSYNPNGNTAYNVPRDDLSTGWTDARFSWWSSFPKWITRRGQIDDHYTFVGGTQPSTTEIFSVGACRWGVREDLLRAVAVQESDWHEHGNPGDTCTAHPDPNEGYGSYGIMQMKNFNCSNEGDWGGFPRSWYSTPFNVDLYGAAFRACLEQSFWYTIPAGDSNDRRERGCVGAWFSGSYNPDISYTSSVYGHLANKDWLPASPPSGATVFLSPTGSDIAGCTQAAPCRTIQRGVTVASTGQTVELAAGAYSGSVTAQKTAPGVIVKIAASGTVTISGLSCSRCTGITFEGDPANARRLDVGTFYVQGGSRVTLRYAWQHWDGNGGNSGLSDAADQITIDHNEIGPVTNCGNYHVNTHIPAYSTNIVWSGNFFHDFQSNAGCHSEAIWMAAVNGGGLIGNKFKRIYGNTADVFITTTDGTNCQGVRNFLIKDNYFGPTSSGSGYGMQFAWDPGGSGDCGGPAPHAVHQNLDFSGNCWDGSQVVFYTITNPGLPDSSHGIVPGGSVVSEFGDLSSAQHDEGVKAGFTFDQWPYKPIGSCPLDSSG